MKVSESTDAKAASFQDQMDDLMESCFPMKNTTRRTTDEPWIDDFEKTLEAKAQSLLS